MNKNKNEYDCPACGNPLPLTKKEFVFCHWCNTKIIPAQKKKEAEICAGRYIVLEKR